MSIFGHDLEQLRRRLFDRIGRYDDEDWRTVVLPDGDLPDYRVSSHGRVVSLPRWRHTASGKKIWRGKLLSASPQSSGHYRVGLMVDGRQKTLHVHRLVMWAFVGPQPEGAVVRHLDGTLANNRLDNLAYDTPWASVNEAANRQAATIEAGDSQGVHLHLSRDLVEQIGRAARGDADPRETLRILWNKIQPDQ